MSVRVKIEVAEFADPESLTNALIRSSFDDLWMGDNVSRIIVTAVAGTTTVDLSTFSASVDKILIQNTDDTAPVNVAWTDKTATTANDSTVDEGNDFLVIGDVDRDFDLALTGADAVCIIYIVQ